jgi:hypothetical protein
MSTQRGTRAWARAGDRRRKAVEGANAVDVKPTRTPRVAARLPTDEPTDVCTASDAKKNGVTAASAAKAASRSKRAKGELTESPTSPEREGESADAEDAGTFEDEDNERDEVSSGRDEGYIHSMIATADRSRGDAMDPDVDFSAVLHEVPIEIRRRLTSNESGFTESVMRSEALTFCRGCRRTLSLPLHFDVNNKTCRQCLIRQRLKRKRYAARNSEQIGVQRTTEARHE